MNNLLVYSPLYRSFSYGPHHPLRPTRLHLTHVLMEACGLLALPAVQVAEPVPVTRDVLAAVHANDYLDALQLADGGEQFPDAFRFGLGYGDNPIFGGLMEWSLLVAGGTIMATRAVADEGGRAAFHTGGGFHHAHRARAAGFCYINDLAVAIADQVARGRRVLYLDIDAHHGDGVQEAFYDTDRVLTISFHESPDHLFPGTGYTHDIGEREGAGYSINVPLSPGTADRVFMEAFEAVVPGRIESFSPDLVMMQLGVDAMVRDPLAHLMLTNASLERVVTRVMDLHRGPLVATGGGGYEMDAVARGWTLAWGLLNNATLPEELPEAYVRERARYGATGVGVMTLRDLPPAPEPDQVAAMHHLNRTLKELRGLGVV